MKKIVLSLAAGLLSFTSYANAALSCPPKALFQEVVFTQAMPSRSHLSGMYEVSGEFVHDGKTWIGFNALYADTAEAAIDAAQADLKGMPLLQDPMVMDHYGHQICLYHFGMDHMIGATPK